MTQDMHNTLKHVAIIMDGNGRWAINKGFKRTYGHKKGSDVLKEITKFCLTTNIKYLTLYAFSTENWERPKIEVDYLMNLLSKHLKNNLQVFLDNNIRFKAIGNFDKFSKKLQELIKITETTTTSCNGLTQVLALNYGSKDEIIRAINKLNEKNIEINEKNFEACLDTAGFNDVDLLIRTGGEKRLSNYLLWQNAYAELFFTNTLWPDFSIEEFQQILIDYSKRERRFGGI